VDVYHLRRTGEVRILVAVLDITKIPKFADVCVKGCMYRLFFKPDEEVIKVANQEEDEDLLTDDDKGKDADGDREMGDANPSPNPQGGDKEKSTLANTKPSTSQSGPSHRQATLIQEALDMACEQLFDEISIKVMLEKDSEGLNHYIPLTEEERRMYNAMVAPPINPHPFFLMSLNRTLGTLMSLLSPTMLISLRWVDPRFSSTRRLRRHTPFRRRGALRPPLFFLREGMQGLRWGAPRSLPLPSLWGPLLPQPRGMIPSPLQA
jgi:hypothetical protein